MPVITSHLSEQGILTMTLNRPEKLNALNQEVLATLAAQLTQVKHDKAVKAVLLTGAGKAFCAGADIHQLANTNAATGYEFATAGQQVFRQLETLGKPSLAAINGVALGGGCELAMATSMRLASTLAQFAQPEVKLGVIPGYGGTQRLARLIGKGRALDLCLTGKTINATQALSWGLITEIVAAEQLIARATEVLQEIIALAPLAIRSILEVIDSGYDMPLPAALHVEALHFALTCATDDKTEGVNAFLQKRSAHFCGK